MGVHWDTFLVLAFAILWPVVAFAGAYLASVAFDGWKARRRKRAGK